MLGGIYTGWLAPVEAGAAGAAVAVLIALVRKRLTLANFWETLVDTGHISANILFLITAASMYSRMLGISGLPNELGEWIAGANMGLYGILAIYVLVLIILGTVIFVGFMPGIIVGILLALFLFVLRYSMISAIQDQYSLANYRSSVERSQSSNLLLDRHGGEGLVYTLRGFLFFLR